MTASPNAADTRAARLAAKRRRRREQILDAARRAFRDHGYHATTLDDIAARLGIRNTALYHYFPDKEALLYACHQASLVEVERLLDGARAQATPAEQLAFLIREHVRVMTDSLEGSSFAFEVSALHPKHQAKVIAARDRYEEGIRAIIREGTREGAFRPVDPKVATFAILGAINWIARWYRPAGRLQATQLGHAFADHLVGGLSCR